MGIRQSIAGLIGGTDVTQGLELIKSFDAGNLKEVQPSGEDPQSLFYDPYAIIDNLGFKERITPVSYRTLDLISKRVPAIGAIVQLRCNQMANFTKVQTSPYEMGYKVKLRDSEKEPTRQEKMKIRELETFIQNTGARPDIKPFDNFERFMGKIVRDSLVYDQATFEVVRNKMGIPSEFYAIDAASVRIADSSRTGMATDPNEVRYVQIYDSVVVAEFTSQDLCFGVRNPRTDLVVAGYGLAEAETAMQLVTALLWGIEWNTNQFSQNTIPKSILNMKGAVPQSQLKGFRRQFYGMLRGVGGAFKMPILSTDADLQHIMLQQNNREMEFSAWLDFLLKYLCAIYQADPAELNFQFGNTGQSSSMGNQSNDEKITQSKDKGLKPLVRTVEGWLNQNLIWEIDENYIIELAGLNAKTAEQDMAERISRVSNFTMIDEERAKMDLPPLPDGTGQVVLNQVWLQAKQGEEMAAQQAAYYAQNGGEDAQEVDPQAENSAEDDSAGKSDVEKSLYKSQTYEAEL